MVVFVKTNVYKKCIHVCRYRCQELSQFLEYLLFHKETVNRSRISFLPLIHVTDQLLFGLLELSTISFLYSEENISDSFKRNVKTQNRFATKFPHTHLCFSASEHKNNSFQSSPSSNNTASLFHTSFYSGFPWHNLCVSVSCINKIIKAGGWGLTESASAR